jgi:glycolate oxidase
VSTVAAGRSFLDRLRDAGDVVTDPEVLAAYRTDQAAPGLLPAGDPAALVRPTTTAGVAAAVRAAAAHRVPIVPRGAGSGLSGGANAIDGCLVLCLERMSAPPQVDADAMTATVQAGVVNADLGTAAAEHGLWYPPDPASWESSTIGGNVATNAGGLCCVKYGVTRDALLAVEAVLADGRVVDLGRRTRKGVAGYDLAGLLCGSEGTLAVITEATVKLLPTPPVASTLAASFATLAEAGDAVRRIVRSVRPTVLELMDRATIAAVEAFRPMGLDAETEVLVFARSDAGGAAGDAEVAHMERLCRQSGATLVVTTDEEAEGRMLMAARRLALTALEHNGATLLDDVAVPLPAIPALLTGIADIAAAHDLLIGTFGHAGDGNMHPTIVYDPGDAAQVAATRRAFAEILDLGLALGGTVSGEHGIGLLKRDHLATDLGPDVLALNHAIKATLDPAGILNPGKAI